MKTRAIISAWHKYQPYGSEFYEPIFNFYLQSMKKYENEYDKLYLIDSTWGISDQLSDKVEIIKVNPSLRYYDAYKEMLPLVKEDLVLFMDNDTVVYREGKIKETFDLLEEENDVVSIYDSIGEYKTDKLNGKNKFCPYWFAARKELLMKHRNVEWGDHMPHSETLGLLTEAMLNDGCTTYEIEEDKSSIFFEGVQDGDKSKDLGYYHIRAGSTPAYLLAEKKYGNRSTYWSYIHNQPRREYLRQLAWYHYMELSTSSDEPANSWEIIKDIGVPQLEWINYMNKFKRYHGLV